MIKHNKKKIKVNTNTVAFTNTVALVLLIAGIILLLFGILLYNANEVVPLPKPEIPEETQEENQDEIDKMYNRERNKSPKFKEKHCVEDICILELTNIYEKNLIGIISGEIVNNSRQSLPAGYLKADFIINDKKETLYLVHDEIKPQETFNMEMHYDRYDIIKATDYKLSIPTDEEVIAYEATLH